MAQELNYLYAAAGMETAASGFSMEQELADWSELQYDLLVLIARRLNLIEDYLNFGSVCKSWHSVSTKDNFNNYLCRAPWLMLAEEEDDDGNSIRKFFSLYNGMILNKRIPKARRKRCMESMGWLIMIGEEEGEISMLHPFSGVEIELPHQNTTVEYNRYRTGLKMYFFYKAVLSSSPSHTSDYILVVIEGAFKFLSFWRPGDIRWTRLKFQGTDRVGTAFYDLIYFNGQIYALDYSGILIVFDVADAVGTQPTKYHIVAHMPLPPQLRREQLYIVESLGSLFVILRDGVHLRLPKDDRDRIPLKLIPDDDDDDDDYTYGTTNFRVFQVDSAAGIMTETRELGDTAFFLGANSSLSVQACQFPGIKPNHIYFTDDCFLTYLAYEEGGGLDMGVFNLADGSIQPHYNGVSLSRFCPPTWIEIDSKFLEEENIMDYSLLLGVHYRAPQHLQSLISCSGRTTADGLEIVAEEESLEDEISPQGLVLVPRGSDDSVVVGPHVRGSRLRASSATGDAEVDLLLPGTARFQIQLGVNMPSRAEYIPKEGQTQVFHEVYDVVLYLGIIDILQEYNMSKKLEHAYKSIQFDSVSISAVDPTYYSERVLEFIRKVFPTYAVAT